MNAIDKIAVGFPEMIADGYVGVEAVIDAGRLVMDAPNFQRLLDDAKSDNTRIFVRKYGLWVQTDGESVYCPPVGTRYDMTPLNLGLSISEDPATS